MEVFTQLLTILKNVITAFSILWTVWGGIILGTALKDKSGPEIKNGFSIMLGGVLIFLSCQLLSQVHF